MYLSQRLRRGLDAATYTVCGMHHAEGHVTTPAQGLGCCDLIEPASSEP